MDEGEGVFEVGECKTRPAFRGKHLVFGFAISSIGVWQRVSLHIKNKPKQNRV